MRYLFVFLLPLMLCAEMLKVGDAVQPLTLQDQFDKPHKVGNEAVWVVTWDKMTTRYANRFFEKHRSLIESGKAAMIVDVSQTPSGIMSLFVLTRMQSYDHTILLSYDEAYNRDIPYEEGSITLLFLNKQRITKIAYAGDEAELEKLLQ